MALRDEPLTRPVRVKALRVKPDEPLTRPVRVKALRVKPDELSDLLIDLFYLKIEKVDKKIGKLIRLHSQVRGFAG